MRRTRRNIKTVRHFGNSRNARVLVLKNEITPIDNIVVLGIIVILSLLGLIILVG